MRFDAHAWSSMCAKEYQLMFISVFSVFQEVPCCICRCRLKPIPCPREEDRFKKLWCKSKHHREILRFRDNQLIECHFCQTSCNQTYVFSLFDKITPHCVLFVCWTRWFGTDCWTKKDSGSFIQRLCLFLFSTPDHPSCDVTLHGLPVAVTAHNLSTSL